MTRIYANETNTNRLDTSRTMRLAGIVGVVAAVLAVIGLFISGPGVFFQGYLLAFLFWLGISLGSLALLLMHFLLRTHWGLTIRRVTEAGAGTLWLMAVLFVPLLFGLPFLFPWARPAEVQASTVLQAKGFYLNVPFFIIRAVVYFAIWIVLALIVNRMIRSLGQSETSDLAIRGRLQGLGAFGLILYVLTMTFAGVDWLMSLQPFWNSSIFGMIVVIGQVLTALSFAVVMLNMFPSLSLGRTWAYDVTPVPYKDLGALLFVFVFGFAYLAYFQMLIMWAGNIPREVVWYIARVTGGWQIVAILVALFQFVLPFAILLSVRIRHNLRPLAVIAAGLLLTYLVDLFWHVKPAFYPGQFAISWLDIVLPVAIGGIWLALFLYNLQRRPALTPEEQVQLHLTEEAREAIP